LSKLLNIDENEASVFIEKFKSKFPGLKNFISEQLEICRKNSYVETVKKRKRYLNNINSTNINLKAKVGYHLNLKGTIKIIFFLRLRDKQSTR
jgi:DNA polymerase-1